MKSSPVPERCFNILVVDNDPESRSFLRWRLPANQYCLREETTAAGALKQISAAPPDAVLLDPALPDTDGISLIREIRSRRVSLPIVVLAPAGPDSKAEAFRAGADDFLPKPLEADALSSCLRALRRRLTTSEAEPPVPQIDGLFKRQEGLRDRSLRLSSTEFKLLRLLAQHPNVVLTYEHLIREVWGSGEEIEAHMHSLRVYVARLRRKLEAGLVGICRLETAPNLGYRFQTE